MEAASGQQKVANNGMPQIALEARNATEPGNDSEAEFGKAETRAFVGDDQVAREGQLQAASKTNAMHAGNRGERACVKCVHGAVNALMKIADTCERGLLFGGADPLIEFTKV